MKTIYLDNAATTPIDTGVLDAMLPYYGVTYGNPSSLHTSGRRAKSFIDAMRLRIAHYIGAQADEIIFTGSGTESDNLALLGAARANVSKGRHIIVSAIEHKAVIEAVKLLAKEGFEISFAPVDIYGVVDIPALLALVRDDTVLVSVMLANNEVGTIQPITELRKVLPKHILLHTDACQAAGHLPLNVLELGVDLLSLNGSKIYGPKGIGVLYKKSSVHITPLLVGGDQEGRFRAGTESLPNIVGMTYALEKSEKLRESEHERLWTLRTNFITELNKALPQSIINGHPEKVLPHIISVTIPNIEGESMLLMLDNAGIEVATGSACSAQDLAPSHVLQAIGQPAEVIHGSVRFSLGRNTTQEDLTKVVDIFSRIVTRLTAMSALTSTYEK